MASDSQDSLPARSDLEETVTVGGTPGGTGAAATPGRTIDVSAVASREYVAGNGYQWYSNVARALPWYLDDVGRDFGADIYERMLLDAQVRAVMNVLKASVLEDGVTLTSPIDSKEDDGYQQAADLCDAAERMLGTLETSLDDVLWDMLDGVGVGNRIAEQVFTLDGSRPGRRFALAKLTVKPYDSYAFVIDVYFKVVGILGRVPGQPFGVQQGTLLADLEHTVNLLPRSKFAVFSFRPRNGDPRGTSALRPAFDPWNQKQQIKKEFLKYLTQFATPSLIGYTAEGAEPYQLTNSDGSPRVDSYGNPVIQTPEMDMLTALQSFANGVATVFPFGAKVQPIEMQGAGEAFLNAFDFLDRQIAKAVLHQTLATEEGQHQTRAASGTHKDILDTIVRQAKRAVERMITRDILTVWLQLNGQGDLIDLLPMVTLGTTEQEDLAPMWLAAAALNKADYLHSSQYADLDRKMGLPERTPPDATTAPVAEAVTVAEVGGTVAPPTGDTPVTPPAPVPPQEDADDTAAGDG